MSNKPLQKTMFKTIGHTFDKQSESTTNTEHNKYYDRDPNMKLTNILEYMEHPTGIQALILLLQQ